MISEPVRSGRSTGRVANRSSAGATPLPGSPRLVRVVVSVAAIAPLRSRPAGLRAAVLVARRFSRPHRPSQASKKPPKWFGRPASPSSVVSCLVWRLRPVPASQHGKLPIGSSISTSTRPKTELVALRGVVIGSYRCLARSGEPFVNAFTLVTILRNCRRICQPRPGRLGQLTMRSADTASLRSTSSSASPPPPARARAAVLLGADVGPAPSGRRTSCRAAGGDDRRRLGAQVARLFPAEPAGERGLRIPPPRSAARRPRRRGR